MKTLFLIVEYNPFHNGHLYHINRAKQISSAENVVAVMSGNFVQRGEPAILDKWARTETALRNGADIVVELPVYYSSASAAFFAEGAVTIADRMGLPGVLCFGSECGDIGLLKKAAHIIVSESDQYKADLKASLSKGNSFPTARAFAAANNGSVDTAALLSEPNNILAVEYLAALDNINSSLQPLTIKRSSSHHHDRLINEITSAGAIRKAMYGDNLQVIQESIPPSSYEILSAKVKNGEAPTDINRLSTVYHYLLKTKTAAELFSVMDINEGLENRMLRAASAHHEIRDNLSALRTKRYTYTMLQRAILHLILDIKKDDFTYFRESGGPQYIRVLGFKKEKAHLLRDIERHASLPLLMNIKNAGRVLNASGLKMLAKEIEATDIYNLSKPNQSNTRNKNHEYNMPIIIV